MTNRPVPVTDAAWLRNLADLRFSRERRDIGERLKRIADALTIQGDALQDGLVEREHLRGEFLKVLDDQPFLRVGSDTLDRLVDAALSPRPLSVDVEAGK